MIKKIIQITASFILVLMLISCKNTKQKLQEYVTTYKSTAVSFKAEDVTLTTARGYINDNKIELRFETALEQNEANKVKANTAFPALLKQVADRDPIFTELVNEGVQFHVYYLADDNTVLLKEVVNKETLPELLK